MQTFSVGGITRYIHDLLDADSILGSVWVQGEVSNFTKAASGHWYFTMKDAKAQLRCVMFRRAAQYVRLKVKTGDDILAHGRVSVYDARGEYQLYVDQIEAVGGIGDLHRQFEALKAKLDAEGLFDAARKAPIPDFPQQIGIVTSPTAAAYQDMQNVLRRRFPLVKLILSPTPVQGQDAAPQIVKALQRLNRHTDADVIIIARGGGSIEDLRCFNDEGVARAVAASRIPVISGIGHEIDFTIVDFVADLRAPTPSSAAELATPSQEELWIDLDRLTSRLAARFEGRLADRRQALSQARRGLAYETPMKAIRQAQQQLAQLESRLKRAIDHDMERLDERLAAKAKALDAANPANILARGYALVRDEDGDLIRSAGQVSVNQRLTVQLHEGQIKVRVGTNGQYRQAKL